MDLILWVWLATSEIAAGTQRLMVTSMGLDLDL